MTGTDKEEQRVRVSQVRADRVESFAGESWRKVGEGRDDGIGAGWGRREIRRAAR